MTTASSTDEKSGIATITEKYLNGKTTICKITVIHIEKFYTNSVRFEFVDMKKYGGKGTDLIGVMK